MIHRKLEHTESLAPLPCMCMLQGRSTSSHTPGCPVAEHGEESGAVVTRRRRTGYLSPSSLGPALLEVRHEISEETDDHQLLIIVYLNSAQLAIHVVVNIYKKN